MPMEQWELKQKNKGQFPAPCEIINLSFLNYSFGFVGVGTGAGVAFGSFCSPNPTPPSFNALSSSAFFFLSSSSGEV